MLQCANSFYKHVNLAGQFNNRFLDSNKLINTAAVDLMVISLRNRLRPANKALPQRIVDALSDVTHRAKANAVGNFGVTLALQRGVPLFWLNTVLFIPPMWGVKASMYPLGELLLGRGHEVPSYLNAPENSFFEFWQSCYASWTHHGLAGAALEAAPLKAATYFERRGQNGCAAACVFAAAAGRGMLQAPRLLLSAAAVLNDGINTLVLVAVEVGIELCLRFAVGTCVVGATTLGYTPPAWSINRMVQKLDSVVSVHVFDAMSTPFAEATQLIDRESDHLDERLLHQRMREYSNKQLLRFKPIVLGEATDDVAQVRQITKEIADDLRRYCTGARDNAYLCSGLFTLKTFTDLTWPEYVSQLEPLPELEPR